MKTWQIVKCCRCGLVWDEDDPDSEVCDCIDKYGSRTVQIVSCGATNADVYEIAAEAGSRDRTARVIRRYGSLKQIRARWLWFTWGRRPSGCGSHGGDGQGLTLWLNIAGHKPLAHLPRWRRRLLHLPSVRWRLWPKPWNFNGPTGRHFRGVEAASPTEPDPKHGRS